MTAEPNGPSLPPPDTRRIRTWLHSVSIAMAPILASGAIWLAYEQGSQDRELAAVSTKVDAVALHAAMDTAHVDDRAHRIRDDFDSYKLSVQADLVTIKTGIAKMQQMLDDRLPPPTQRHASFDKPAMLGAASNE